MAAHNNNGRPVLRACAEPLPVSSGHLPPHLPPNWCWVSLPEDDGSTYSKAKLHTQLARSSPAPCRLSCDSYTHNRSTIGQHTQCTSGGRAEASSRDSPGCRSWFSFMRGSRPSPQHHLHGQRVEEYERSTPCAHAHTEVSERRAGVLPRACTQYAVTNDSP